MKKLLAVLLTLALALTLALPALAEINWDQSLITAHTENLTIEHGDSFTLRVDARASDGAVLEYQWYRYDVDRYMAIEGADEAALLLGVDDPGYPNTLQVFLFGGINVRLLGGASANYRCEVTEYQMDGEGNQAYSRSASATMTVKTRRTLLSKLLGLVTTPLIYGLGAVVGMGGMTMGMLLPLAPVIFIAGLAMGLFDGIRGLFAA